MTGAFDQRLLRFAELAFDLCTVISIPSSCLTYVAISIPNGPCHPEEGVRPPLGWKADHIPPDVMIE